MTSIRWTTATLTVALVACVPSRSQLFGPVETAASARTGHDVVWRSPMMNDARVRDAVRALIEDGLELDEAVRIGLLNNRIVQASFDQLGIARADLAAASVLRNPEAHASVRFTDSDTPDLEIDATQDVLGLLTLGRRRSVASAELEAVRLEAVGAVVDLVAQVRGAYYAAQAADQKRAMRATIAEAMDASYTLARKLHEAGNIADLELLRERDQYELARIELATAEAERLQSRERLNAALGLWAKDTGWTLSGSLAEPPDEELDLDRFEGMAVEQSLELEATRWRLRAAGGRIGMARLDRWLPGLAVGVSVERDGAESRWGVGPAVAISIPLWDRNRGAIERAERTLSQSQHRYHALAVAIRADARSTRERLRATRETALAYRDTVLPLRAQLLDETQKARNAMAVSSFELLLAKRRQIEAAAAYIDALLAYWQARTAAEQTLAGRRPSAGSVAAPEPTPVTAMPGGAH